MTVFSIRWSGYFLSLASLLMPVFAQAQTWQSAFALPASSSSSSRISKVVADGAGGYVVAGIFTGAVTVGNFTLTSAGSSDIFVARFNSVGNCTQAVRAGGSSYERATALTLDATGTVTVLGEFGSPTIAFGATTLTNAATTQQSTDVFVARLSMAGQWTQAVRAGGAFDDTAGDIALDPNGSVVVAGTFRGGSATFGPLALTSAAVSGSLFVARLNSAGTWTQAVGAQSSGAPNSADCLTIAPNGETVVAGSFFGALPAATINFGPFRLTSPASITLFVARLSRSGTWTQAAQASNTSGAVYPTAIATDANGNVALAGNFRSANAVLGPYTLFYNGAGSGQGGDNLFVARLNAAGVWTQAAQSAGSENNSATGLVLDASGNIIISGYFGSQFIGFGTVVLTNHTSTVSGQPTTDVFVARLNALGIWDYQISAGGAAADYANALALDGSGAIVVGSIGDAPAMFGPVTLSVSGYNSFVARLGGTALATATPSAPLQALSLAPNPTHTAATLRLPAASEAAAAMLFDALGRPVRTYALPARATSATLDLTGLPPGLYVIRCGAISGKLVVE